MDGKTLEMMLPVCLVLFASLLLHAHQSAAKEYHLDFTRYCQLYKDLKTFEFKNSDYYPALTSEVHSLKDQLRKQGYSYSRANERCQDPAMYFKTECLFLKREKFARRNDWGLFFGNGEKAAARPLYFDIWLLHPALRDCQRIIGRHLQPNQVKKQLLQAFVGAPGKKIRELANLFTHFSWSPILVQEIDELCGRKDSDSIFCTDLLEIMRLAKAYYTGRMDHGSGFRWKAFRLHFAMIQQSNPQLYSSVISTKDSRDLLNDNLDQMFLFINGDNIEQLREMAKTLPQKASLFSCDNLLLLPKDTKKICMFWKALSQVRTYFQSSQPLKNGMIKKMLNTKIDYPQFLARTEMREILSTVQNQNTALVELSKWVTSEVKKDVKKRFTGLKTYFQKMSSFNKQKASADISFIKGRLDKYKTKTTSLSNELSDKLGKIISYAFTAVAVEIAEDIIQVGLSGAVLMNPLEKLFGGNSLNDFMDRSAKLANSLTNLPQLVSASRSFKVIRTRTSDIATKFGKNGVFLDNLNKLINEAGDEGASSQFDTKKDKFLEDYKNYDPLVTRPELVEMTTVYGNLVDSCCDVILNTETTAAAVVKGTVKSEGLCSKTKAAAERMFATFAEIYDFQFDLIEEMASYMRALNAHYAANDLDADYDNLAQQSTDTIAELQSLTKFAYISYKINLWTISESYCDVLTYKEGGKTPSVCKESPKDIARLASHVSPTCTNTEAYKNVPIESTNSDEAFMKLSDLYTKNPVYFKVPSSQWLVDNKWISENDKDSIIFLKKFEIFLPFESSVPRLVTVDAEVIADNKLSTSSKTSYIIVPKNEFVFHYYEGRNSEQECRQASQVMNNPYGSRLSKLCRLNVDDNNCQELLKRTPLFPSVYSRWKLTVSGYDSIPLSPTPANDDFKLKVGVKLCILRPNSNDQSHDTSNAQRKRKSSKWQMHDQERPSCPKPTDYWSDKQGHCVQCPKGSKPGMDGYFCVKKQENPP
ncbi:hypothetical protein AC249_AIPGENE9004 [Exaiptasia diaphana]|nr:hypothetical protein AC249_AIPGENE9004 [Exaiptasia diaphana]